MQMFTTGSSKEFACHSCECLCQNERDVLFGAVHIVDCNIDYDLSLCMRKPTIWVLTRSDTN